MRYAVIDIGTNSVLLLIGEPDTSGKMRVVRDEAQITRLGEHLAATQCIGKKGINRTTAAIKEYIDLCRELCVTSIHLIGTEVFRRAKNTSEVLNTIRDETGCSLTILTSNNEAVYSFQSALPETAGNRENYLVIDIGGGSTEIVLGSIAEIQFITSLAIGAVTLYEQHLHHNPPLSNELLILQKEIKTELNNLPKIPPVSDCIGIGGTVTTLASIHHSLASFDRNAIEGTYLSQDTISQLLSRFITLTSEERAQLPGMERGREDIIIAGTAVITELLAYFLLSRIRVSTRGVRYGYLQNVIQKSRGKK